MISKRQIMAIHFIEDELPIKFKGNISNREDVSSFIGKYLEDAKEHYEEYKLLYEEALESVGDLDVFMYGD